MAARIQDALTTLAGHGVTENQVQTKSRLSSELWSRFTDRVNADLTGIKTIEVVMLAEALMLDVTYLISGGRRYSVKLSPCGVTAMIQHMYPAAG